MNILQEYRITGRITPELILAAKGGAFPAEDKEAIIADLERIHQAVLWFEDTVWFNGELQKFVAYTEGGYILDVNETRCTFTVIERYVQFQFTRYRTLVDIFTYCDQHDRGVMGILKVESSAENAVSMIKEVGQSILLSGPRFRKEHE